MRLFIAVPLADSVVTELGRLTGRLRSRAAELRWPTPESWHVTLQFLGNASEEQYGCLIGRLAEVRGRLVPVQLGEPGIFERAGVFYAGVELSPQLIALQQRVAAATAPCGFEPETRPFRPHITLARSKGRSGGRELRGLMAGLPAKIRFSRFTAAEFLLYESHLSSAGATYEVRQRFSLAGAE
ncbi:MAG TPA: RNA 2',3'-cyclic phosphodiesterase [Terracidiphilus sp.]|nr:RNA 2',3'-cyclic phosphodiesterase [Terracidiphilus sp.]